MKAIKSKFSIASYLTIAGVVLIIVSSVLTIVTQVNDGSLDLIGEFIVFGWIVFYIIWWEVRNKIIVIKIHEQRITVKSLGITKSYILSNFDGYKLAEVHSKTKSYEHLYLFKNGKRMVLISSFYIANYKQFKDYIVYESTYLGIEPYGFINEFVQGFKQ
ncbi:hypothetical protein [Mucilaginibacter gracilis]|nr:hypothetical protein [Mucilaginibacter gracilis]